MAQQTGSLAIILAAGEGKRMRSTLPKVLHPVAGLPMVCHTLAAAKQAGFSKLVVVVGNQAEWVSEAVRGFEPDVDIFEQTERLGTAHAVLAARKAIETAQGDVVVLYGDAPLIRAETIDAGRKALADGADVVMLGFHSASPTGYGRLIMNGDDLLAIREEKDATDEERAITFCNSGITLFSASAGLALLDAVGNDNSQGEYYLTDIVEIARRKGLKAKAIAVPESETQGVNDRVQLASVEEAWQQKCRTEALLAGVTMQAPDSVYFHFDTVIGEDVTIEPNVVFGAGVTIADAATIRAFSHLEGATVGQGAVIGPYARLRPGSEIGAKARIGNFVETKAAVFGEGAKANHLSYIGDANVGPGANIGAGTITCNYDGFGKHRTIIGANAFIGSNTALVAPVSIGASANTAAGSAIAEDVPDDALGIARNRQVNLEGKAKELRERFAAAKASKT